MPFLNQAPKLPLFLADVTNEELRQNAYSHKTLELQLARPGAHPRPAHINGIQFHEGDTNVWVMLNRAEEWKIENTTAKARRPRRDRSSVPHPRQSIPDHRGVRSQRERRRREDRPAGRATGQRQDRAGAALRHRQKTPNMDPRHSASSIRRTTRIRRKPCRRPAPPPQPGLVGRLRDPVALRRQDQSEERHSRAISRCAAGSSTTRASTCSTVTSCRTRIAA